MQHSAAKFKLAKPESSSPWSCNVFCRRGSFFCRVLKFSVFDYSDDSFKKFANLCKSTYITLEVTTSYNDQTQLKQFAEESENLNTADIVFCRLTMMEFILPNTPLLLDATLSCKIQINKTESSSP